MIVIVVMGVAVTVVVMIVPGFVRVAVGMIMAMVTGVVMAVALMVAMVVMRVVMMIVAVRPAVLGIKRRFDCDDLRAGSFHCGLELGVALQAQTVLPDLDRNMVVAEVPGKTRHRDRIFDTHLEQRLRLRHHFHQIAVIEQERIVGAHADGIFEIELDAGAAGAEHETALRRALRVGQDQRVDDACVFRDRLALGGRDQFLGERHQRMIS